MMIRTNGFLEQPQIAKVLRSYAMNDLTGWLPKVWQNRLDAF